MVRVNEKIICSSSFSAIETKNFIESARKICGMDCEITVDTLEAHYWNYKTDPKEQDKSLMLKCRLNTRIFYICIIFLMYIQIRFYHFLTKCRLNQK